MMMTMNSFLPKRPRYSIPWCSPLQFNVSYALSVKREWEKEMGWGEVRNRQKEEKWSEKATAWYRLSTTMQSARELSRIAYADFTMWPHGMVHRIGQFYMNFSLQWVQKLRVGTMFMGDVQMTCNFYKYTQQPNYHVISQFYKHTTTRVTRGGVLFGKKFNLTN